MLGGGLVSSFHITEWKKQNPTTFLYQKKQLLQNKQLHFESAEKVPIFRLLLLRDRRVRRKGLRGSEDNPSRSGSTCHSASG